MLARMDERRRRGPLDAAELAEAAVLGDLALVLTVAGWFLPAGTVLHVIGWHDNSSANRYNPDPRNWVGFGNRSIDDMSFAWMSLCDGIWRHFTIRARSPRTRTRATTASR